MQIEFSDALTCDLDLDVTYVDFYRLAYISLENYLIALKISGHVDCVFGRMIYVSILRSHAVFARGSAYMKTRVTLKQIYAVFSNSISQITPKC